MARGARQEKKTVAEQGRARPLPFYRGVNREQAADYIGVSPGTFDKLVADGRMPGPKRIDNRKIWDLVALDRAFDELPNDESSTWDRVL